MKNFRKVLALVLVVATLFSFTAMAGAAYKDDANISYDEAVAVLSAVGILNGYEDGTFKPTQTISREEMAKMIAVLANAGDDISTLYASASTFADVPASKWSASYVAYCAKTGIVAGRSATTFDPAGKVTGLETAKMLLVTLGFDAEEQGYVGADWKVNVLRDAKVMGLLNNFAAGYDVDAAITREQAAQMMLNALEAPCVVGVISDGLVTITNALIVNWPGAGKVNVSDLLNISVYAKLQDAIKAGKWCLYGNVVISNDLLCDRLYNMEKLSGKVDCLGRPSAAWMINGKLVAYFAETPVWTSVDTNPTAVAKKAGKDATYYLNGEAVTAAVAGAAMGKGVNVEVYADGEVVVYETKLGYVGQMDTARGKFMLQDAAGNDVRKVVNAYGFTRHDEGTKILYVECNKKLDADEDGIHSVEVAEIETIKVHAVREAKKNICDADEKVYEFYKDNMTVTKDDIDTTIEIILANGYIIYTGAPAVPAAKVAVLVSNTAWREAGKQSAMQDVSYTYGASFVDFEDGAKVTEYAADKYAYGVDQDADHDVLVEYTTAGDARVAVTAENVKTLDGTYVLSAKGQIAGLENLAANDYTQYILRVWNYSTGKYEYKYFDGKGEVDATYELDHVQYLKTADPYLDYVYAEAKYAKESNKAFVLNFVTDETYAECINEKAEYVTYYLYNALVDGEEALVAYEYELKESRDEDIMKMYKSEYVLIKDAESHDELPIYKANEIAEETVGEDFIIKGNTLTFKKGGALGVKDMADNAKIWVIAEVDGEWDVKAIADYDDIADYIALHNWDTQYAWVDGTPVSSMILYCVAGE